MGSQETVGYQKRLPAVLPEVYRLSTVPADIVVDLWCLFKDLLHSLVSSPSMYYHKIREWWTQYEAPLLLFVSKLLVLSYCNRCALRGSANDMNHMRTTALAEYLFTAA